MYFIKNFKKLFDFNLYLDSKESSISIPDLWNSSEIWWNLSSIDRLKVSDDLKNDIKKKCVFLRNSEVTEIVLKLVKINESDIKNIFSQIQWPLSSYEVEEFLEKLYLFSSSDDFIQNSITWWNDWIDSSKLSPKQKESYELIVSLRDNLSQVQSSKEYFGKMKAYLDDKIKNNYLKAEIKWDIEKGDPTIWLFISFINNIYNNIDELNKKEVEISVEILKKLYELRKEIWIIQDEVEYGKSMETLNYLQTR